MPHIFIGGKSVRHLGLLVGVFAFWFLVGNREYIMKALRRDYRGSYSLIAH